jgi:hypothetical protein
MKRRSRYGDLGVDEIKINFNIVQDVGQQRFLVNTLISLQVS